MKILFVVEHFYPYVGGAEELFLNLTVSLAEAGYEVSVVTTQFDKSGKKSEIYKGVSITRVNCYNRFLFTVMSLPEIIRQAKNVYCIHTTSYNSAIPSFIAGMIRNKKVLITFHEVWGDLWFKLPYTPKWLLSCYYLYEWSILKLPFYKYIAVSDFTRNSLIKKGIPENKIIRIYNGLNYSKMSTFSHQPPEAFTFCFFGRLGISKGLDLLLDATQQFCSLHPNARLKLIIPTYPEKLFKKIIHSIKELKLEKNIDLLHNLPKDRLLKEVSTSSCAIVPSYSEGFCFVAVESVAMGVPVISSGKGALSEVIGGQHLTFEKMDSFSLLQAMIKAYKGTWDQSPVKAFPLKDSINEYLSLYKNLST